MNLKKRTMDEMITHFNDVVSEMNIPRKDKMTLLGMITAIGYEAQNAADVVPVVRCRDCKHRDPEDKKCDCGGLEHAHMFPVSDDWFCADGERMDGDGDV